MNFINTVLTNFIYTCCKKMWDNNNYIINKKLPYSQSDPEYKKELSFSQLISEVQVFLLLSRKP